MDKELREIYDNPDYPVSVKFIERKKDDALKGEWTVRPTDIEIIVVNNGELRVSTDGEPRKATAGQGIFINMGVRRFITSIPGEDTAYYSVVFSPSYIIDISEENSLYEKYLAPAMKNKRISCLAIDEDNIRDENTIDRVNDIIAANTMKRVGYEIATKSYLCMLWALLLDYLGSKEANFNGKNLPSSDELRARTAVTFIMQNYSDQLTLEDIADKIHVSRNECCRCFKRILDISPVEYLIRVRIFEAAKVLYKDPLSVDSISELAFKVGFNNTSYFNKAFKKYIECTPKEFSKMLKNQPEMARKIYDNLQESVTLV